MQAAGAVSAALKDPAMDPRRLALSDPLHEDASIIRRFLETDTEPLAEFLSDEKAPRYLPFPQELRSAEGAKLLVRETMERYHTDSPSLAYAVAEFRSGYFIGFCGMNPLADHEVELMYAVIPARWGEGFGSMIASALIRHVFAVDPQLRCVAFVHPSNRPSISIAERLGFELVGLTEHDMFNERVLKFRKSIDS